MRNIWDGKILELATNGYKKYLSWKKKHWNVPYISLRNT